MRELYAKLFDLLDRRARRRFVLVAAIMVAVALAELIDPALLEWTPLIGFRARIGVFDGEQEAASFP